MKIVILTNIPSPYRVDFFCFLQNNYKEHEFHIIYSAVNLNDRSWSIDQERLINSHFLKSKTLTFKRKMDAKHIHIAVNTGKTLSALSPDLIICTEYNLTIIQAVTWAIHHHIPYISWTDGTLYSERNINKLQKLSRAYIIKHASAFIASSTRAKEAQITYGANPNAVFLSSLTVDIQKYLYQRDTYHSEKLLYVGSLSERKGVDLLFHALSYVTHNYHLTLVGNGDKKSELIILANKLHLTEHITFAGYQEGDALKKIYQEHDIFILPTREDCFGLVLLEAMCASMPIISSCYADGAYDLVKNEISGYIADPYNAKIFAQNIDFLLGNTDKVQSFGDNAYKKAFDFNFNLVSKKFLEAISYISKSLL